MMDGGGWWMGAGSLVFLFLIVVVVLLFVRHPDDSPDRVAKNSAAESSYPTHQSEGRPATPPHPGSVPRNRPRRAWTAPVCSGVLVAGADLSGALAPSHGRWIVLRPARLGQGGGLLVVVEVPGG